MKAKIIKFVPNKDFLSLTLIKTFDTLQIVQLKMFLNVLRISEPCLHLLMNLNTFLQITFILQFQFPTS
jgi:hypothetical protein